MPHCLRAWLRACWMLACVALPLAWPLGCLAATIPPPIPVLTIDGPINPVVAAYVRKELTRAGELHPPLVVIRLDTPGGLDSSMREIVQAMIASPVPVVVYVAPPGARAASAGMFITMGAHLSAMAPDTAIGAAHPVGGDGSELRGPMADKVTNDAAAYVRGLARARGRNAAWAEAAVRKSVSLNAQEALRAGVVEVVEPSVPALLQALDGRTVHVLGQMVVLSTRGVTTTDAPMNAVERFLYALSNPTIALLLLNLGVLGIIFELQNPTGMFAGVAGVLCLLLGLFGLGMAPGHGIGVALLLFGLLLFALELFVPSYGLLTLGGLCALVLGSLMLYRDGAGGLQPGWPLVLTIALSTGALIAVGAYYALRAQRRRVTTGREALVGRSAEVREPLTPVGLVFLNGELWQAELQGASAAGPGEKVVVTGLSGLTLQVRKKHEDQGKE